MVTKEHPRRCFKTSRQAQRFLCVLNTRWYQDEIEPMLSDADDAGLTTPHRRTKALTARKLPFSVLYEEFVLKIVLAQIPLPGNITVLLTTDEFINASDRIGCFSPRPDELIHLPAGRSIHVRWAHELNFDERCPSALLFDELHKFTQWP